MTSGKYHIEISDQQTLLTIDETELKKIVRHVLRVEEVAAADISIAVVDNDTIWDLNQRYLCHDYPTDVLSFLLDVSIVDDGNDAERPRGFGKTIDGELIVSAEMAIDTAAKYDWTSLDELVLYVVHGLLHLCGYDDQSDREREQMRSRERKILERWNLSPRETTMENGPDAPASADNR